MYKSKPEQLPDTELDIMRVLWQSELPMTATEIIAALGRSWKLPTAHVLLNRLIDKGYIEVAERNGRSNSFRPIIGEDEYTSTLMRQICGGSVMRMVASFIENDDISDGDIDELTALLEAKKRELIAARGEKKVQK